VMDYECEFCTKIADPATRSSRYDFHVIGYDDNFHVVVALGALTGGHLLLVSNSHKLAMSELSENEWESLGPVLSYWTSRLKQSWGAEPLAFEHGPSANSSGGACVYHAHLQLLPLAGVSNGDLVVKEMTQIRSMRQLRNCYPSGGYLMMSVAGVTWAMSDKQVGSQFFRRRICALQGRPDEWDYLVYPNSVAMDETISLLAGRAMGGTSFSPGGTSSLHITPLYARITGTSTMAYSFSSVGDCPVQGGGRSGPSSWAGRAGVRRANPDGGLRGPWAPCEHAGCG
jgi:diadenosine tetraphosphate (Ap4A) HIT family hydrolase